MKPDPTVIFLHIPKTAGTTLFSVLWLNYAKNEILLTDPASAHPFSDFSKVDKVKREKMRVLIGHFAYGMHTLIPRDSIYITVLREPIERFLSDFYHIKREPAHGLHHLVKSGQMTMQDYLERLASRKQDNIQTRLFAGDYRNNGAEHCSDAMLDQAKENLKNEFAVVGLTERFDETLLLIKRKLGWKYTLYKRRNVTSNRPKQSTLSRDQLQLLQAHHRYDLALYSYAITLFETQVEKSGHSFQNELAQMQRQNMARSVTLSRLLIQINRRLNQFAFKSG